MKRIILLSGFSGTGKSYIADIMQDKGWLSLAFADYLKDIVSKQYNIDRMELESQEGKKRMHQSGITHREILIKTAIELKKKDIHFFSKYILKQIIESKKDKIVISDMRYPHEFYFIKTKLNSQYDIQTLRVHRNIFNKINDKSELSLESFNFDLNIYNDDTLLEQLDLII
jgi:dephospho-CoA kinase